MTITEHFTIEEFAQHPEHGHPAISYPAEWIDRLRALCHELEVVRAHVGHSLTIVSGYRSEAYNEALYAARGKPPTKSQHTQGRAADVRVDGYTSEQLHAVFSGLIAQGKIQDGGLGLYPGQGFVHYDLRGKRARWVG